MPLQEQNINCSTRNDAGDATDGGDSTDGAPLVRKSFPSRWDGPPVYRLEEEGLGKGIDATRPDELLDTQICPTTGNVERLTVGTGYQEFSETLEMMSSLKNTLSSSVSMGITQTISFKFGFDYKREKSSRMKMTAHGKQIHNETVLFKTEQICHSSTRLATLLAEAAGDHGFQYSPGKDIPEDKRDEICKDVVRNKNHGATHYISSVDLGAKVYTVTSEHSHDNKELMGVTNHSNVGMGEVQAKVSVDFSHETLEMSRQSEKEIYFVIDRDVQLKSERTDIKTNQEKTIAFDVRPVWQLIQDTAWRKSVKRACKHYVDEHTPISVGPEDSFLIKTGTAHECRYLKVTDNEVEGTSDKSEAHLFALEFPESSTSVGENDHDETDKMDGTDTGFYLFHQAPGGERLYLAADTENELIVPRTSICAEEQAKFFLAHPVGRHLQPISEWEDRKSLLLLHHHREKTFIFSKTVYRYLVLQRTSGNGPFVLKEAEHLDDPHSHCQFALEQP